MSQKTEKLPNPAWTQPRVYLPDSGPKKVGVLPDGLEPPSRPVAQGVKGDTKTRTVGRPAQGHTERQSVSPSGSPESRTATNRSVPR